MIRTRERVNNHRIVFPIVIYKIYIYIYKYMRAYTVWCQFPFDYLPVAWTRVISLPFVHSFFLLMLFLCFIYSRKEHSKPISNSEQQQQQKTKTFHLLRRSVGSCVRKCIWDIVLHVFCCLCDGKYAFTGWLITIDSIKKTAFANHTIVTVFFCCWLNCSTSFTFLLIMFSFFLSLERQFYRSQVRLFEKCGRRFFFIL